MSSFFSFLPVGGWQRLMCDALWQSTLIAGLGWLAARFLVRQSAARAWVLLITLIACAVVPLASLAARSGGWTMLAANEQLALNSAVVEATTEIINSVPKAQGRPSLGFRIDDASNIETAIPEPIAVSQPQAPISADRATIAPATNLPLPAAGEGRGEGELTNWFFPAFGFTWLATSAFLAVRLMLSLITTQRLLRRATPCDDPILLAAAAEAARRIGITCPPVLLSRDIETPTIYAFRHPRLLVPQSSPLILTSRVGGEDNPGDGIAIDWVAAFSHELAHVARGDGWSRLGVECILIMLPVQPLIWLLRRSFHTACEESCDDWAVATGSNPIDLAETLTAWINRRKPAVALAAIGMSSTKSRTLRLLSLPEQPNPHLNRHWGWLAVALALSTVAGLAAAQTSSSQKPPAKKARPEANRGNATQHIESQESKTTRPQSEITPPEFLVELNLSRDDLIASYKRNIDALETALDSEITALSVNADADPEQITALKNGIVALKKLVDERKTELRPKIVRRLQEEMQIKTPALPGKFVLPPYVIEPPDILLLTPFRLVPRDPVRVQPLDTVFINAEGTAPNSPIAGKFKVSSSGEVVLGPHYGTVKISGLTRREAQEAVTKQLKETLQNPEVALTVDESRIEKQIEGQHLVGPDGTINLGVYGQARVAGDTIEEARKAINEKLSAFFRDPEVAVDIYAYNSQVYYVISQGTGGGDNIQRFPITGNETVLDAISQVGGVRQASKTNVWIARPSPTGVDQILPVKWDEITQGGGTNSNYQIFPGDRVYIDSPQVPGKDSKILEPPATALPGTTNF
jgi:polysaccharide biosynthesis/export protein